MITNEQAAVAAKLLDYYDGKQTKHLINILNDPSAGRRDWRNRGIIPRTRNLTQMIVDKSALLFGDKAPKLEVYVSQYSDIIDETSTTNFIQEMDKVDWVEFFTNLDSTVRMLKTVMVLVQYDQETGDLVLDLLTRKNSAVVMNRNNRSINTLVYKTSGDEDEEMEFRVFTQELIQDIKVDKNGKESIIQSVPNPYGIIPAAVFHDSKTPRADFWNHISPELLQINDIYNLHITDSEFAASWSKLKTLFTNCDIKTDGDMQMEAVEVNGSPLPRMAPALAGLIGGPSRIVQIDTTGVDSPFVEYKGPEIDLLPIDTMMNKWVADFAADWCVNVKEGNGAADSGFKLIVEELPNLELRKKRAKMMEAGFRRFYEVVKKVVNMFEPGTYGELTVLSCVFFEPILPVNQKDQEDVWSRKISEKRATRVDYFMAVEGKTKEEAIAKVAEIDAETAANGTGVPDTKKFSVKI